jgi:hypothetical protein
VLKKQFSEVEDACALAQAMVDTVREPLIVLDKDLRVVAASRSFYVQLVEIDIALAGRPDVADLETVGLEPIFHQPHFLGADPVLPRV